MAKIVDPDSLNQATEIVFDKTNKTIQLLVAGNLDDTSPGSGSGVTLQAVYSFCKEEWKSDTDLNKLRFPFDAITEAKMDLVNGWDWEDQQTKDLIRDGGWALRDAGGSALEQYMCIVSLGGTFEATVDLAYYQQVAGFDTSVVADFDKTDELNEPVKIFGASGYGSIDYTDFFKIFLREQGKIYDGGNLIDDQNLAALDYTVFKLPLVNSEDIKIASSDVVIDTTGTAALPFLDTTLIDSGSDGDVTDSSSDFDSVTASFSSADIGRIIAITSGGSPSQVGRYEIISINSATSVVVDRNFTDTIATLSWELRDKGMTISFLKGSGFTTWADSTVYPAGAVVYDAALNSAQGGWAFTPAGGTSSGTGTGDDIGVTDWEPYDGEEQIGSSFYAFNVIVDGNTGQLEDIYEWCQRRLRADGVGPGGQPIDINDQANATASQSQSGSYNGFITKLMALFLGDTLQSQPGVLIRDFDPNDTNRIELFDITVDSGGVDSEGTPLVSTKQTFPFVAAGTIVFNDQLVDDVDAEFTMYFLNDDAGDDAGFDFDTVNAIIVEDNDAADIADETITANNRPFTFDYDGNTQRGSASAGEDAPVVIVAMGLDGAQWIEAQFLITRAVGLSFPVNAAQERNYSNPS